MAATVSSKASPITEVSAYRATQQTLTDNTLETFIFNVELEDNLGEYDHTTGVFTAAYAGRFIFNWTFLSDSVAWTAGDIIWSLLSKDGSTSTSSTANKRGSRHTIEAALTAFMATTGTGILTLAAGETGEIKILIDRGANTQNVANGQLNQLQIQRFKAQT
jgi:hypothetical protein